MRALSLLMASLALGACSKSPETGSTQSSAQPVVASALSGETIFARCAACHTKDSGGRAGIGPNLFGVVGRPVASVAGFNYSDAMKAKGGAWDAAALDQFITSPAKTVPGTRMGFAGISNAAERKALIDYLSSLK